MLKLVLTAKFRKDFKTIKKRGYNTELLEPVIQTILEEKKLDRKYKDHELHGDYEGYRECHIAPDWLLIYRIDNGKAVLYASRTGTHSDLF